MAANNLLDEMIQVTEPSSTNVALNMPSTLNQLISQNYPQQEFRDLDAQNLKAQEYMDTIISIVEGVTTGNIPLPIGRALFRGIGKWMPGSMVKGGRFVGGDKYSKIIDYIKGIEEKAPKSTIFTTTDKNIAEGYARRRNWTPNMPKGQVLEFDIPDSYIKELLKSSKAYQLTGYGDDLTFAFKEGIPKEFFKKLHYLGKPK